MDNDFETLVKGQKSVGVFRESLQFLGSNKKYWLLPLVMVLMGIGVLILLSSTAAAPFIYTLF